jgi:hypothetical protein
MEQVVSNAEGGAPSTVSAQHSNDRLLGLYVLPKFPLDVTNALTNGDSSVLSCRSIRSKIIGCLYEDMLHKVGR